MAKASSPSSSSPASSSSAPRVAVVAGLRTPFCKQATAFTDLSSLDLGRIVVRELLERSGVPARLIQRVVFGQVVPSLTAPNIAREVVLGTDLPRSIDAFSVSRACATSYQSVTSLCEAILAGQVEGGLAGGADSASVVPVSVSRRLAKALVQLTKARTVPDKLAIFAGLRPADLLPEAPALKEPSTGLTMGESAEVMAKDWGITREEQDQIAHRSHARAGVAWSTGLMTSQVMTVFVPPKMEPCAKDELVRADSDLANYAKLKPAFDRKHGTITAANSSALTDGAAAVILVREDRARAEGLQVLGTIKSWAFAALDPAGHMLMGPAHASPLALERAGMKLSDMDVVDMHEAFAAQVACNLRAFDSAKFAKETLGRSAPLGAVDPDKLNIDGGSIALGHPFAATGARQLTQTLHALRRRGGGHGLVTACAAGGLGAAMVVEVSS